MTSNNLERLYYCLYCITIIIIIILTVVRLSSSGQGLKPGSTDYVAVVQVTKPKGT